MERLGIPHQALRQANPQLIVCALTGYGQEGPLARKAGHDLNYVGRAGLLGLMGPEGGPPQVPSFQVADVGGGLFAVVAILAALRERDRTRKGAMLDLALADAALSFAPLGLASILGGEMPVRGAEVLTGGIAAYHAYVTKDGGFMTLAALEPKFLERFCDGAGIAFDPMALVPGPHQQALKEDFSRLFASKTRAEWERVSEQHDCCLEPVLDPGELRADPQLRARGFFDPAKGGALSTFRNPLTPIDLEPRPAPWLGEHSVAILRDAGFGADEIANLRGAGIIR
jgi:crotonobetainyl-CoA:carnitine CoA-transferase CaiB-like acyl-CoA transferase